VTNEPTGTASRPYHHGDLRRVLLDAATEAIAEDGPTRLSMRDVARRVGVSHAAPAHHFRDKTGLLTAVAVRGYQQLADALAETWDSTHDFLEVGVAYVRFALANPAAFDVMFRPYLLRVDDPDLAAARARSRSYLYGPAGELADGDEMSAGVAGWSLVHGLASLWLNGVVPPELGDDPEQVARMVGRHLFAARRGRTD
jgi:AcrR family transcriptional regulator